MNCFLRFWRGLLGLDWSEADVREAWAEVHRLREDLAAANEAVMKLIRETGDCHPELVAAEAARLEAVTLIARLRGDLNEIAKLAVRS